MCVCVFVNSGTKRCGDGVKTRTRAEVSAYCVGIVCIEGLAGVGWRTRAEGRFVLWIRRWRRATGRRSCAVNLAMQFQRDE